MQSSVEREVMKKYGIWREVRYEKSCRWSQWCHEAHNWSRIRKIGKTRNRTTVRHMEVAEIVSKQRERKSSLCRNRVDRLLPDDDRSQNRSKEMQYGKSMHVVSVLLGVQLVESCQRKQV